MPHVLVLLQEQSPSVEVRVAAPSIDLSGIGQAIINAVQNAMPQLATSAAEASVPALQSTAPTLATSAGESVTTGGSGLLQAVQSNPLNILTATPPELTYTNGVVQQLQTVTLTAAWVALALVIAWAGLQVLTRSTLGGLSFEEAFSRVVIGAAMLGGVRLGTGWALDGMNRLSAAVLEAHVYGNVLKVTVDLLDGGAGLVLTLFAELAALWLYLVMWGRIVLLDILLVFAPLAITCWILPQTRGWWSVWVRQFFGWALVGPAVTLLLVLGLAISGSLGNGDPSGRLAALLLSTAVFIVGALKVPSMVVSGWGQTVTSGAVAGAASTIATGGASAAARGFAAMRAAARK